MGEELVDLIRSIWGGDGMRLYSVTCVTCCMLSAEPHVLWIFSALCPTPRKLLNASVVRLTRTFRDPILRNPRSFSARWKKKQINKTKQNRRDN